MSGIHTPFLGGTGFGGRADPGGDSALAPPYVPGEEGAIPDQEEGAEGPTEAGFAAAAVTVPEQEAPEEPEAEDQIAEWAAEIAEEEETRVAGLKPAAESDLPAGPEPEAEEETVGEVDADTEERAEAETEFPDFLFGGDAGEAQEAGEPVPADDVTSGPSPASRLDPETRERIRALARELEGDDAPEDVIARAFEEGYRKAREEEN